MSDENHNVADFISNALVPVRRMLNNPQVPAGGQSKVYIHEEGMYVASFTTQHTCPECTGEEDHEHEWPSENIEKATEAVKQFPDHDYETLLDVALLRPAHYPGAKWEPLVNDGEPGSWYLDKHPHEADALVDWLFSNFPSGRILKQFAEAYPDAFDEEQVESVLDRLLYEPQFADDDEFNKFKEKLEEYAGSALSTKEIDDSYDLQTYHDARVDYNLYGRLPTREYSRTRRAQWLVVAINLYESSVDGVSREDLVDVLTTPTRYPTDDPYHMLRDGREFIETLDEEAIREIVQAHRQAFRAETDYEPDAYFQLLDEIEQSI